MRQAGGAAVPSWFWIVAGLAVLWEAFGCYTYVTQSPVPDAQRVGGYAKMESWQWGVFAIAVWSGLIGALLLLARSRWATALLLVSLLAAAIQYGVAAAQGGIDADARPIAVAVLVVGVLLVIFASRARRKGWLR
jgi:hypothetical protein